MRKSLLPGYVAPVFPVRLVVMSARSALASYERYHARWMEAREVFRNPKDDEQRARWKAITWARFNRCLEALHRYESAVKRENEVKS